MQYIIIARYPYPFGIIRLNPTDPNYVFNTEEEAQAKATELQNADTEGIQYKASPIE
jgi:hypothetical protein